MVFITHFLLNITKRESETKQVVNLSKANLKPMAGKMVRFGKAIGKFSIQDGGYSGLKWYNKNTQNEYRDKPISYKYQSPYYRDYNKSGYIKDEIIIYAKPGKITSYIFYDKQKQKLFFGVTDSSFTFHPSEVVSVYSEELESLEEVPLFIDICFVNGSKNVNKYKNNFQLSPIPVIMLSFKPRIFSSSFNISDMENPVFGEPNIVNEIYLPYTGIRKKELLKKWLQFKSGIPRQIPQREVCSSSNIVHRVTRDGYLSDEEPLDVRQARLRRNRAIEAAIERAEYNEEIITLDNIPEPDERGYINFDSPVWPTNYNINNPTSIFTMLRPDDDGNMLYYTINGRFYKFNPREDVKLDEDQYGFYWCPTDNSYGIRCKKGSNNNNRNNENETNNEETNEEREPARMVSKYIYLQVLNYVLGILGLDGMQPVTMDFYSRSYYHLGRLRYDDTNIRRKEQVSISAREFEINWENRLNN